MSKSLKELNYILIGLLVIQDQTERSVQFDLELDHPQKALESRLAVHWVFKFALGKEEGAKPFSIPNA